MNPVPTQVELVSIANEHYLRNKDIAEIVGCTERMIEWYIEGKYALPEYRMRLLKLELGLQRPRWTPVRRRRRELAKYL